LDEQPTWLHILFQKKTALLPGSLLTYQVAGLPIKKENYFFILLFILDYENSLLQADQTLLPGILT
jgi:hypothetical protein